MIIDVGDLQTIECGMFKEHQLFVPTKKKLKKLKKLLKRENKEKKKINHYETDYFGGVIPVYESQIKR